MSLVASLPVGLHQHLVTGHRLWIDGCLQSDDLAPATSLYQRRVGPLLGVSAQEELTQLLDVEFQGYGRCNPCSTRTRFAGGVTVSNATLHTAMKLSV